MMKRWNYWTSYHLCLKYNPFNQFFHRFSINFHNNEKHIALKPNLRKILISRSFNKHTKNPSTRSRGVESTFTWRGESSFDVRVKRWKRWERWMTRRERLWNEMDEGWHREKFCNRIPCNADCRDTFANFPLSGIESNERGRGLEPAHLPTANSKDQST